ncbi:hypothetical protein CC1G_06444 [Coprinopsis cinerea okayama7|uniref:Signal sequence receptor subunit alpha n=1 Tax=Coprinopsis cinerea (strain Okayama-7 / 130 / ATCC MYA-4618 / FGSC 9003) TaxID=240176 RepID=A8NU17_COPC7|nr:hypothetical protein CC1G_06444 [Coprinopsis cinerea okayama7\|eukprot:XP_001836359.1 hypothetical protein CC1G_06444 [Coprinopsis cinerea okayama7\
MRFSTVLGAAFSLSSLLLGVVRAEESVTEGEPEITASAAFPEDNAFNQIVNGRKNALTVTVSNKSGLNATLVQILGSLTNPNTGKLVKNLTEAKYNGFPLLQDIDMQIPYVFYSEFKPGEHRLNLWVEHQIDDKKYRVEAYDSVVSVVEPEFSIFDIKLILTYLIVAGILGGAGFLTYQSYVPQKKKGKKTAAPAASTPVTATATGAGGYEEEWIPAHHLKKPKSAKKASGGFTSGTSGDELSAAETSGTEARRRKGKKN